MRLRIIAGELGGRFIQAPDNKGTRPTTDRVRETFFNILNNLFDFENARALDLYAGSGALGFEALSRGAERVHFVEKNFNVYKNLQKNIASLGVKDAANAYKSDVVKFTAAAEQHSYDLILADPPFFNYDIHQAVKNILEGEVLSEDGLMLIERSIQTEEKDAEGFGKESFKRIGDTLLYSFSPAG